MASVARLDLGSADIESKTSGLRLHLSSSANFAPSAEDDVDQLQKKLTACQLNKDSSILPWVSRGHSFKLVIALKFKHGLRLYDQDALLEHLNTQLQSAKVFTQVPSPWLCVRTNT